MHRRHRAALTRSLRSAVALTRRPLPAAALSRRLLPAAVAALGAVTLTAGPAVADPAGRTGTVLYSGAAGALADSWIVVLKPEANPQADVLGKRYGGTVRRTYTSAVRGFNVTMNSAAARRLAADPAVAYVEQDRVVSVTGTQVNPTWGLDRIDQRALPLSRSYTAPSAANVTAYVLDTGIRTTHAEFGGRARDGWDFVDGDAVAQDCQGHGTHVAGTVGGARYGVAKDVKLVGVRVLGCDGSGTYSKIIAGVDWVTRNAVKPAVANMSLGGPTSAALDDAVKRSMAAGITYVLAAGNDTKDACQQSPARTPAAITVGATDSADARSSFSNFGSCLDLFAPGSRIVSAAKGGDTATITMSGTSMAAPHVAGAAALALAANPTATPAGVRDLLVNAATPGKVTDAKTGSPNRLLFTDTASTPMATAPTPAPSPAASPKPTASPTPAAFPKPTVPPSPTASPSPTAAPKPTAAPSPAPACGPFSTTGVKVIMDRATVTSTRTVSGCTGTASTASTVTVKAEHTHRGSLVVTLTSPSGVTYRLKEASAGDSADDLHATYPVDASASPRNGTWKLTVRDAYEGGIGYLEAWSLKI